MASIATRTGDDGTTSLLYGQRVAKDHPQIEAVGAFDELNVAIGMAKAHLPEGAGRSLAESIQKALIGLMGEISCAEADSARYAASNFSQVGEDDLSRIDQSIARLEASGLNFQGWATPGGNLEAAAWDQARVVARRAERRLCGLPSNGKTVRPILLHFTNRLSDLLWLLAREAESRPVRNSG